MADVPTLRLLRISPRLEAILHDRKVVTMRRYIAFLRAINVGGHTVTMDRLRQLFEAMGFGGVETFIASGREGDMPLTGFSPRKQNLTLYIMGGLGQYEALLQKLGKHTTGKACLYIKRLEDIHLPTLKKLIRQSVKHMARISG